MRMWGRRSLLMTWLELGSRGLESKKARSGGVGLLFGISVLVSRQCEPGSLSSFSRKGGLGFSLLFWPVVVDKCRLLG